MAHATNRTTAARGSVLTRSLWLASLVFFVGGDVATTHVGLQSGSVREVGPVASLFVGEFGVAALLVLKLVVLAVAYAVWRVSPPRYAVAVPLGLAVGGVLVTGWNTFVLLVVLV
jgi:hypothetical protein